MESLKLLRLAFNRGLTKPIEYRKGQLKNMFRMIEENEAAFCDALKKDMNKSEIESKMSELLVLKQEISYLLKNIDIWTRSEKVSKTFVTFADSAHIQRQPFGVALCIGAWNYPVQLALLPVAGLLAAGNCVILKPSELAPNTEKLLSTLIPKYLDKDVCAVELGDGKRTSEILKERFDFIMYTGSTNVGKLVMEAAAKHVTPILLELGGKSPTYIDKHVDMKTTVKRLMWAKYLNCGQTCVAPDYILCHSDVKSQFLEQCVEVIEEFYTKDADKSPDYARIINDRHYNRLMSLITETKGKIVYGGKGNKESQFYVEPTLVLLDNEDDVLMRDEIFGPILPILTVDSSDKAIEMINNREKPLGIYLFSSDRNVWQAFEKDTTSGTLLINDAVVHCGVMGLPFGGVGNSGFGSYHGKASIEMFTHKRGVLNRDTSEVMHNLKSSPKKRSKISNNCHRSRCRRRERYLTINGWRYPPYNPSKLAWTEWGLKSNDSDRGSRCSIQ